MTTIAIVGDRMVADTQGLVANGSSDRFNTRMVKHRISPCRRIAFVTTGEALSDDTVNTIMDLMTTRIQAYVNSGSADVLDMKDKNALFGNAHYLFMTTDHNYQKRYEENFEELPVGQTYAYGSGSTELMVALLLGLNLQAAYTHTASMDQFSGAEYTVVDRSELVPFVKEIAE